MTLTQQQNKRLIVLMILSGLFVLLTFSVKQEGFLTVLNLPLHEHIHAMRTLWLDKVMVCLSMLGQRRMLIYPIMALFVWFLYKKQYWLASHWLLNTGLVMGGVWLLKRIIQHPRPDGLLLPLHSFSYPSGHSSIAVAIYGFFAVLLMQQSKAHRSIIPMACAILISLVVFSARIYLGAHWLTDVIAGAIFGSTCALFSYFSLTLRDRTYTLPPHTLTIAMSAWLVSYLVFAIIHFHIYLLKYAPAST